MPKKPVPSVSGAAVPDADADAFKPEDSASDLAAPLASRYAQHKANFTDSKPHSEPAPSEDLDADSDADSYITLSYEVETESGSELESLPDADDVPRAQAPRHLHRSVTAPF